MENLNKKVKQYFKDLKFKEETHKYSVGDKVLSTSVSALTKVFEDKVDFYAISLNIDKKLKLPTGSTNRLWKYRSEISLALGTSVHYFAELAALNLNLKPKHPCEEAALSFLKSIPSHFKVFETEIQMYHKKYMFGGMADLVLINTKTNELTIIDYKTNKDLFKCFGNKKLLSPFHNFVANSFNKYQIQFSLYQILLEQVPGVKVRGRKLVHLKKDGGYEVFNTEDLRKPLKLFLSNYYDNKRRVGAKSSKPILKRRRIG